jgi:hypothetical protein
MAPLWNDPHHHPVPFCVGPLANAACIAFRFFLCCPPTCINALNCCCATPDGFTLVNPPLRNGLLADARALPNGSCAIHSPPFSYTSRFARNIPIAINNATFPSFVVISRSSFRSNSIHSRITPDRTSSTLANPSPPKLQFNVHKFSDVARSEPPTPGRVTLPAPLAWDSRQRFVTRPVTKEAPKKHRPRQRLSCGGVLDQGWVGAVVGQGLPTTMRIVIGDDEVASAGPTGVHLGVHSGLD